MTTPITREFILDVLKPVRSGRLCSIITLDGLRDITNDFNGRLAQVSCANDVGSVRWYERVTTNSTLTRREQALFWSVALLCRELYYVAADADIFTFVMALTVACDELVKALLTEQMRNQTIF